MKELRDLLDSVMDGGRSPKEPRSKRNRNKHLLRNKHLQATLEDGGDETDLMDQSRHSPHLFLKDWDSHDRRWNYRILDRWLESQVGKPWDKVYSHICKSRVKELVGWWPGRYSIITDKGEPKVLFGERGYWDVFFVLANGYVFERWGHPERMGAEDLYVDSDGLIQMVSKKLIEEAHRKNKALKEERNESKEVEILEKRGKTWDWKQIGYFVRIKDLWFEVLLVAPGSDNVDGNKRFLNILKEHGVSTDYWEKTEINWRGYQVPRHQLPWTNSNLRFSKLKPVYQLSRVS